MRKLLNQWTEKLRHHRRETDAKFIIKAQGKAEAALIASQSCMNCKVPLTGPYCHICGQKDDDLRRPFWTFLQALLDDLFSSDSRLIKSLILLVLVPGGLTRAYVQGRRAAFVPPIRAYLVMSVIFFLALELSDMALIDIKVTPKTVVSAQEVKDSTEKDPIEGAQKTSESISGEPGVTSSTEPVSTPKEIQIDLPDVLTPDEEDTKKIAKAAREDLDKELSELSDENREKIQKLLKVSGVDKGLENLESGGKVFTINDVDMPYDINFEMFVKPDLEGRIGLTEEDLAESLNDETMPEFAKNIIRGFSKGLVDPIRMNDMFNKWLPRVLILIVPIFAFMLRLSHWGPKQYYFNQLMFSLHYHTFLFLLMTALLVIVPRFGGEVGLSVFFWGAMIYMFISLKIAQEQGWIKSFFKFLFLWFVYVTMMFTGLFAAFTFGLQEI